MVAPRFEAILAVPQGLGGVMNAKRDVRAHSGDVVVVHGHATGDPGRTGVILDVLEPASAREHYRVRWDEEHVSLFWPGSDATLRLGSRGEQGQVSLSDSSAGDVEDAVPDSEC